MSIPTRTAPAATPADLRPAPPLLPEGWKVLAVGFVLFGVMDAAMLQLYRELRGFELGFGEALARNLAFWLLWIPLAVPVLRAGARWPVELGALRASRVALHVAVGLAVGVLHLAAWVVARDALAHGNLPPSDFSYLIGKFFAERIGVELLVYGALVALGGRAPAEPAGPQAVDDRLVIEAGGRTYVVPRATTEWVQADGDYMRIHGERELLVRITLTELDELLGPGFQRVSRSAVVNLARVRELRRAGRDRWEAVLASGTRVPVTAAHREALDEALGVPG